MAARKPKSLNLSHLQKPEAEKAPKAIECEVLPPEKEEVTKGEELAEGKTRPARKQRRVKHYRRKRGPTERLAKAQNLVEAGLTQSDVARAVGVAVSTVARWTREGGWNVPSVPRKRLPLNRIRVEWEQKREEHRLAVWERLVTALEPLDRLLKEDVKDGLSALDTLDKVARRTLGMSEAGNVTMTVLTPSAAIRCESSS